MKLALGQRGEVFASTHGVVVVVVGMAAGFAVTEVSLYVRLVVVWSIEWEAQKKAQELTPLCEADVDR